MEEGKTKKNEKQTEVVNKGKKRVSPPINCCCTFWDLPERVRYPNLYLSSSFPFYPSPLVLLPYPFALPLFSHY